MFRGFDPKDNQYERILKKYYTIELSNHPDYLIYSVFGNDHLKYDCIRIFNTGECVTPNFNECDYAMGFDYLTLGDRYRRIPYYLFNGCEEIYEELFERKPFTKEDLAKKTGFCNFVVSNCFAQDERTKLYNALSTYKHIDSGGRYLNNIGGAVKDKKAFQEHYKFSIAGENSFYPGYTTEKIVDAFAAYTIPIYLGDPLVSEDFNKDAFINVRDFSSYKELIDRIRQIDEDDDLYLQMINANPLITRHDTHAVEKYLCYILDQPMEQAKRRPVSMYTKSNEAMLLRHNWFEKGIYTPVHRGLNQLKRLSNGTFLTNKRTK